MRTVESIEAWSISKWATYPSDLISTLESLLLSSTMTGKLKKKIWHMWGPNLPRACVCIQADIVHISSELLINPNSCSLYYSEFQCSGLNFWSMIQHKQDHMCISLYHILKQFKNLKSINSCFGLKILSLLQTETNWF